MTIEQLAMTPGLLIIAHMFGDYLLQNDYIASKKTSNTMVCLLHVVLYALAHVVITFGVWPVWAYVAVGVPHFPIDRWRLARKLMGLSQEGFATGPFSPWSIIVVDNTLHLIFNWLVLIAVVMYS